MLVNRACSKGVNDTTPAPDINVVVHFDTAAFRSDYLFVIDIADTAYYDTSSSSWVAIPETTYTATMPDGAIPFTTVLGPGEGRLFKIVGTSVIKLRGSVNTNYTYQGKVAVDSSITIASGETFNTLGPARFEIAQDTTLTITVYGKIKAIGSSADSIWFLPYDDTPSSGDWGHETIDYHEEAVDLADSLMTGLYTIRLTGQNEFHIDITDFVFEVVEEQRTNYGLIVFTDLLGDNNLRLPANLGNVIKDSASVRIVYK